MAVVRCRCHALGQLSRELLGGMLLVGATRLQRGPSSSGAAAAGAGAHEHLPRSIGTEIALVPCGEAVLERADRSQDPFRIAQLENLGMPRVGDEDREYTHTPPPMNEKLFISAESLLADSFELAARVLDGGYRPSFIVALWRGGAPIGIAVQEWLEHRGVTTDHIAVRTSSYTGIDQQSKVVRVHAMDYLVSQVTPQDRLLIVDDVFDSGRSLEAVLDELRHRCPRNHPAEVRIATVYYKPARNRSRLTPDWYVHATDQWLVFPHELVGLTDEEIAAHKPAAARSS